MWSSRLWFLILTVLTSALISGALNTSPTQIGGEWAGRELELLIEHQALHLVRASSDLAAQPEIIKAFTTDYPDASERRQRLSELLAQPKQFVQDVMLVDESLSKSCAPGGGGCTYHPLKPWTQSDLNLDEILAHFPEKIRHLDSKNTFAPSWAWVGKEHHLVVMLPVTGRETLGVMIVRGQSLKEVISSSIAGSQLSNRWSHQGVLSVYLGDQLVSGTPIDHLDQNLQDQDINVHFHARKSLLARARNLMSFGLRGTQEIIVTCVLVLVWLLSALLFTWLRQPQSLSDLSSLEDVDQDSLDFLSSSQATSSSFTQGESIGHHDRQDQANTRMSSTLNHAERTSSATYIPPPIAEEDVEWSNPSSMLPQPVGAEEFEYTQEDLDGLDTDELGYSSEIPSMSDDKESDDLFNEFMSSVSTEDPIEDEFGDVDFITESDLVDHQEPSDLTHEEITPLPATDESLILDHLQGLHQDDQSRYDHGTHDATADFVSSDSEDRLSSDAVDDVSGTDVEIEHDDSSDLVAELGQMLEDELAGLFDDLESPEEAALHTSWHSSATQPQAVDSVLSDQPEDQTQLTAQEADEPQYSIDQDHQHEMTSMDSDVELVEVAVSDLPAEVVVPNDQGIDDYLSFERDLADELSMIEDADMRPVDAHAEPEFTLHSDQFFSHLGLSELKSEPRSLEVVQSIAPHVVEPESTISDIDDDLREDEDVNFDFSLEVDQPEQAEQPSDPFGRILDSRPRIVLVLGRRPLLTVAAATGLDRCRR